MTTTTTPGIKTYYNHAEAMRAVEEFSPDINADLYRQAGLYAYWNSRLVMAEMQYDRLSNAVDQVEATLSRDIRKDALKAGTKMTETQIKEEVGCNPKLLQLKGMLVEAKAEVGYLKGQSYALKQRGDTLQQIARNMLVEMRDQTVSGHIKEDRHARTTQILKGVKPLEDLEG